MLLGILVCNTGAGKFSENVLKIQPGSQRVLYSIPFQQTARYLSVYPEDVTKEEREAIDGVLAYDKLAELYDPNISDPVKATFDTTLSEEEMSRNLKKYFGAWFSMFKRHPGVYLEATLHGSYGYYYPFQLIKRKPVYWFGIKDTMTKKFDVYAVNSPELRNLSRDWANLWLALPGTSQLLNSGSFTWILLIGAGYLFYRKRGKGILALSVPALNVAICIASPVNGMLRYSFPLLACLPAVAGWCLLYKNEK